MALDSRAYFDERVTAMGISDEDQTKLKRKYRTMGDFAFSSSHIPGNGPDHDFVDDVIKPLLGDALEDGQIAKMRRLYF